MTEPSQTLRDRARRQRRIAVTILGAFAVWAAAQFVGARLGVPARWIALLDLAALAVLGWAVVSALGLWRTRKE